jgi:hypothetical protein
MRKKIIEIRIALLHATYHRNFKKAMLAKENVNLNSFKKHVYRAEDAWRKIVILTEKIKTNG